MNDAVTTKGRNEMNITANEKAIIAAYKQDCFVADHGWDSTDAAAWVKGFHSDAGLNGLVFSGAMSSLAKKGLILCDGEAFSLTAAGIEVAKSV